MWKQKTKASKRTIRLDPHSAFHQRRTEEKTDGVIFWDKLSPRLNWISCLVQRLPFPDCDVEETQPLAGTCKNAPPVFAQSDKAQRTMSVFPAGLWGAWCSWCNSRLQHTCKVSLICCSVLWKLRNLLSVWACAYWSGYLLLLPVCT